MLTQRLAGVYDILRGTDTIRLVVASEVEEAEHNAPLLLFSAVPEIVQFAAEHLEKRFRETSTLLNDLFHHYQIEGLDMPYTMADYRRDIVREGLKELTSEERLEGLPPEERLKGLPPEEILKGLPPKKRSVRFAGRAQGLPPEERFKGLSARSAIVAEEVIREIQNRRAEEDKRPSGSESN